MNIVQIKQCGVLSGSTLIGIGFGHWYGAKPLTAVVFGVANVATSVLYCAFCSRFMAAHQMNGTSYAAFHLISIGVGILATRIFCEKITLKQACAARAGFILSIGLMGEAVLVKKGG
jgi:hypothetical protein